MKERYSFAMTTVQVNLSETALRALDVAAGELEISRDALMEEAVQRYLEDHAAMKLDTAELDRQFEAGETIAHEDMVARFHSWVNAGKSREAE